jgi:hypothetical protein
MMGDVRRSLSFEKMIFIERLKPNQHRKPSTPSLHPNLSHDIREKKWRNQDLSDLLDTHQDQPTEVRRRDQVKIITTP